MTDAAAAPDEPVEPDLVIVVTLAGYQAIVARLEALEAVQPAVVAPEDDVHARLDRHRSELEAIKRAVNRLLDLAEPVPTSPTPTSEEFM